MTKRGRRMVTRSGRMVTTKLQRMLQLVHALQLEVGAVRSVVGVLEARA